MHNASTKESTNNLHGGVIMRRILASKKKCFQIICLAHNSWALSEFLIYDDCNQVIVEFCADLFVRYWAIAKTMNRWSEIPFQGKKEQSIDFCDGKHKSLVYMGARNLISRSSHMRVHLNVCVSPSSIYRYRHAILLHSILVLASFNNILSFHLSLISFSCALF